MILRGDTPKGFIKDDFWIIPSDWEKTKMKDILEERKEYTTDQDTYPLFSLTIEKGVVEKTDRYERQYLVTKDGDNYKVVYENDFVYNPMNIRFGAVALHKLRYPVSVSAYYNTFYIKNGYNPRFIEYFLQSFRMLHFYNKYAEGSLIEKRRLHYSVLLEYSFSFPPIFEQNRIIEILSTWDKAIELKEKLIDEKKKQKTGLMQKLLTGKVRLSGFDKEWVNVKLKKILKQRNEKSEIKEGLELYSLTIEDGVTPKTDRYNREFLVKSGNKKYKITKCNDIVYNPANLRFGAIAVNRIGQSVLLSPIYEVLYIKDEKKYDIDFVGQLLTWNRNIKYFSTMAEGTLVERMAVKIDAFLDVAFKFPPSLEEQKAIASILSLADKEICILKKEVISLKKQKKGLMQLLLTGIVRVNTQES